MACGALGEGVVAVMLGTSATIVAAHESRGAAGGIVWGRNATRSGYAATGVVLSAGRALEWIRHAAFPIRAAAPVSDVMNHTGPMPGFRFRERAVGKRRTAVRSERAQRPAALAGWQGRHHRLH